MQISNHPVLTALNTYHICLHMDSICTSLFMMHYRHTLFTLNTALYCMYSKPYIAISAPNCTLGRFSCLLRHKSCSVLCGIHSLLPFLSSSSLFMLSIIITSPRYCYCILHYMPITNPPPSSMGPQQSWFLWNSWSLNILLYSGQEGRKHFSLSP